MSWAKHYKEKLRKGEEVRATLRGNSMKPRIESGSTCLIRPVKQASELSTGDVVLVHVAGRDVCHLIKSIDCNGRFQISNIKGRINGTVGFEAIFGKVDA